VKSALGHPAVLAALGAALLFGASTPLAKPLTGDLPPLLLAGLLYLGSGAGLTVVRLIRDRGWTPPHLHAQEWPWLLGAILFGGVLGPVLLMIGLTQTPASTASLLLNLEGVLTALLAWIAFRENTDTRIVTGMLLIVAGGIVLSWISVSPGRSGLLGPPSIAAACLCWAIDNNLTRKVSATDSVFVGASKGLAAGTANSVLALLFVPLPAVAWSTVSAAMLVGFLGYGVSLVLFVIALRGLGAARTGAYFSTAPFIGAALAIALFAETATPSFWIAAALMGVGVWLHLTERHVHEHTHAALDHAHSHVHDAHHPHAHDFEWNGEEPHAHAHRHQPLTHTHEHFPDVHHGHPH